MNEGGIVFPTHQVVYEGIDVTINCTSDSRPNWERNEQPLDLYTDDDDDDDDPLYIHDSDIVCIQERVEDEKHFISNVWTLTLLNITATYSGNYTCLGYLNNKIFKASSTILGEYYR